jgi:hypothetical protein
LRVVDVERGDGGNDSRQQACVGIEESLAYGEGEDDGSQAKDNRGQTDDERTLPKETHPEVQEEIIQQGMDVGGSPFDLGDGAIEDGGKALLSVEDGEGFVLP